MVVLAVPNWSFGRDSVLLRLFEERLDRKTLKKHYLASDVDHNRTVSAFSGEHKEVKAAILDLCGTTFPRIDLNRHVGAHPRVGALDVCPFVSQDDARDWVDGVAVDVAEQFDVPVFLYEKSEKGRHEADLPTLRRGGFGLLIGRKINPDYGPEHAHERLGVTVMGQRDFLVALNVDLETEDKAIVQKIAKEVRQLRQDGDQRFLGVRALGLSLPSRGQTQVSLNLTLPDLTPIDPIVEWVSERAEQYGAKVVGPELIGVIRDVDMEHATSVQVKPEQVVATR